MVMKRGLLGTLLLVAMILCLTASTVMVSLAQVEDQGGAEAAALPHDPSFHREFGVFYDQGSGDVYVSDSLGNRIVKTRMDGTGWTTLGTLGSGVGQFKDPRGIYFDSASGYIFVTDTGNHRIVKTRMDGTGWTTLGTVGQGTGQFYYPRGIWYDPAGDYLYIPDTGNHRIVKTRMDGSGWEALGSEGQGAGQFLTPRGVCFDSASGYLYVADTGNNRIVKTRMDGSGWEALGSFGPDAGQFKEPRGLFYDAANDVLYVADCDNHRIVKTKMDGSGWEAYGSFGRDTGNFFYPRGISFDPGSGDVYVADTFNDRIVETRMDGSGWQSLGTRWRPYVWFFAEGTTRENFDMYLTICNPGDVTAKVDVTYMLADGSQIPQQVNVIGHSRYTINVNEVVGDGVDLSIRVVSNEPVICERPMYFRFRKQWPGGSVVMGRPTLSNSFYFAEGTTREGFQTYLCVQNPNRDTTANVDVTYMFPDGTTQPQSIAVGPHSRATINVNEVVGPDKDLAIVVNSDIPILAERPMYFKYQESITGGHVVIGATEPDTHFYLAEGTTRTGFDEYICLLNPGEVDAKVHLRYMFADGGVQEQDVTVDATSRYTINVRDVVGEEKDVAVEIISDQPIVVERPMYFVYRGVIVGGHNVIATSDLGSTF